MLVDQHNLKVTGENQDAIVAYDDTINAYLALSQETGPKLKHLLSLDPNTVVIDDRQEKLMKVLNQHKIETVPIKMRHMCTQAGGIHCSTLDTVRESKLESYF